MSEQGDLARRRAELSPAKHALLEKWKRSAFGASAHTQTIPPRRVASPIPMSFAQQRLWVLDQLEPGGAAYTMSGAVRLTGQLNMRALQQSINEIVQRHEILRTTFALIEGQPMQVIAPLLHLSLPLIDLEELPESEREAEARERVMAAFRCPFELARGPLLRVGLLRLKPAEHALFMAMHHIVSDGWSVDIFVRELATLYTAFSIGEPSPLPNLPIQYADFSVWQRQALQGAILDTQLAYWKQQLRNIPTLLELPTDHARPPIQTYRGSHLTFRLSGEQMHDLKTLIHQERVTLFQALLAVFQILLFRYTSQDDIVIGTPIAGRTRAETEELIGLFTNTLAVRTSLAGNPSFCEVLKRVREVTLAAYAHQDIPFEQLVEALQPKREMSHHPLFQVMFVLQNTPFEKQTLLGLTLTPFNLPSETSKFDLLLSLEEQGNELSGTLEYNTDLFEETTIQRLIGHYQTLLKCAVEYPTSSLSHLPILADAEQQQILHEWNNTARNYSLDTCLHELIEIQVERTPHRTAVIFEEEQLTYRELNERANALAHFLRTLKVGPEVRVGICMERSVELVVGLLAILKAGGAYVPLDPAYPPERLAFMLQDAQVAVLLTQERLLRALPECSIPIICLDTLHLHFSHQNVTNPKSGVLPSNVAYVIYTSGSTGKPKGVMISHQGICNRLLWMQEAYHLTEMDRVLQKTPFSFDVSVWEFFWPLLTYACLVLARPDGHQDSVYLVELIIKRQITTLHFVPSMLRVFLEERGLEQCRSLKRVICSGEALPFDCQERFFARLSADLYNLYGPTEASVDVTHWPCERESHRTIVPIGRPIANIQIYLLDSHLQLVPVGVPGELYIGGIGIARGYLNRPELTAEKFIPHPFSDEPGARLYKTGDLARYLLDGSIEFLGRIDHQVKLHGFRIELGEIEATLRQCASVQDVVVLAREDTPGDKKLVAYIVPTESQQTSQLVPMLQDYLKEHLPEYMVPWTFVLLETLPLSANGKVDRKALPAPASSPPELSEDAGAPRTHAEEVLARIWADVLGLERVGIHNNFFEVGGDSIRSIQIVSRAYEAGLRLTPKQLFQHRTIAELAAVASVVSDAPAEQQRETALSSLAISPTFSQDATPFPLAQLSRRQLDALLANNPHIEDIYPLAPFQKHMLHCYLTAPGPGLYVIHQVSLLRNIQLNIPAFERAWQQVVNQHPILRTSFVWEGLDRPLQIVHSNVKVNIEHYDWQDLSASEQQEPLDAFIQEGRSRSFELTKAPHSRFALIQLAEDIYQFFWRFSYMLQDGWSFPLILKDFFDFYEANCRGEELTLPRNRPYRDHIAWVEQQDLASAERYWWQTLKGFTAPTPLIRCAPNNTERHGEGYTEQDLLLSGATTAALRALVRRQHITLNTVIQGAWALLLHAYTDEEDVVFGGIVSGRPASLVGVEYMVGSLNNLLPIRIQIEPEAMLLPWLRDIQAQQVEQRQYDYSSLLDIRKWSDMPGSDSLFESYLVFENFPMDASLIKRMDAWSREENAITQTEHPLRVEIWPVRSLFIAMSYYPRDFNATTIRQMLQHFEAILNNIADNPQQRLSDLLACVKGS